MTTIRSLSIAFVIFFAAQLWGETQKEIINNYREFDATTDRTLNCEEVAGQFYFKVRKQFNDTRMVKVQRKVWETCWVYDPELCRNEKVRVQKTIEVEEPQKFTSYREFIYCVKLKLPIDAVKKAEKCDCEDLPPQDPKNTQPIPFPPADLFAVDLSKESANHALHLNPGDLESLISLDSKEDLIARATLVGEVESKDAKHATEVGQSRGELQVRQVSSPTSSSVWLRNVGKAKAQIQQISFKPEKVFATSKEEAPKAGATAITLDSSHNVTSTSGKHGVYEYRASGVTVQANQDVELRISINDPKHRGWGFIGELTLKYDDGNSMTIPRAQVRFVDGGNQLELNGLAQATR